MAKKTDKTNAMRLLDKHHIAYNHFTYDPSLLNAVDAAYALEQNPSSLFKTLVTQGKSREHYVFMVPAEQELDLKKAARTVGEKSIDMLPQKDLFPLTGYIHGGCSPLGMKKSFKTFIDHSALHCSSIFFSAGHVGQQLELTLAALQTVIDVTPADVTK